MRSLWLLLILLLFGFAKPCAAQKARIKVYGTVVDENDKRISDAAITEKRAGQGAITDKEGNFIISLPRKNFELTVSHLSYYAENYIVTDSDIKQLSGDTLKILIKVFSKSMQLPEVQVGTKRKRQISGDGATYIIDYGFFAGNLLIITEEKKNYWLRLNDDNGNLLISHHLDFTPVELVRDCLGEVNIISNDSIYLVNITDSILTLENPLPVANSYKYLALCAAASESHLFLSFTASENQTVEHIAINRVTKEKITLQKISDIQSLAVINAQKQMIRENSAPDIMSDIGLGQLIAARKKSVDTEYLNQILKKPVYVPMVGVRDSIIIFNHLKDSAFIYTSEGIFVRNTKIDYHRDNYWNKSVIVDYEKHKAYTVFKKIPFVSIAEIGEDGVLLNRVQLEEVFPEKIKIKGGYIYYLHREPGEYPGLYKEPLR